MTVLGHRFRDDSLALEALTTPAFKMSSPDARDNQRLEYLGDAVLGLLAADWLYASVPGAAEGSLTARRAHMVSAAALSAAVSGTEFPSMLRRNKGADPLPPGAKTVADAVEAVIGAAWLDGGYDAAKEVFDHLGLAGYSSLGELDGNPKSALQQKTQACKPPRTPSYRIVSVSGKANAPLFTAEVSVEGVGTATGSASNLREAEAAAAARLLARIDSAGAQPDEGCPA